MSANRENLATLPSNIVQAEGIRVSGVSGAVTIVAAGGELFGSRNILYAAAVARVRLRWVTSTAFAAAQALAFRVHKVTGFTAIQSSGGTAIQAHYKRGSMVRGLATGGRVPLTDVSSYIAATGAITGGTFTAVDADEPDTFAVGAGSTLPGVYEDDDNPDGLCFALEANEGIVVVNHITMGASGVGNLFVSLDLYRQGA